MKKRTVKINGEERGLQNHFKKMMTMFQVVLSLIITSICPETETRERNEEREEIYWVEESTNQVTLSCVLLINKEEEEEEVEFEWDESLCLWMSVLFTHSQERIEESCCKESMDTVLQQTSQMEKNQKLTRTTFDTTTTVNYTKKLPLPLFFPLHYISFLSSISLPLFLPQVSSHSLPLFLFLRQTNTSCWNMMIQDEKNADARMDHSLYTFTD